MLTAKLYRRRAPLPARILSYLSSCEAPCHFTVIASRLHIANATKVMQTCVRMAHDGRLRWCGEGMYALAGRQG